jgi:hypothetical protein
MCSPNMPRTGSAFFPILTKARNMPRKSRAPFFLLGKNIGIHDHWEYDSDDDREDCTAVIINLRRNLLGKQALPNFTDGHDLYIWLFAGMFIEFNPNLPAGQDDGQDVTVDFSAFNQ